MLKGLSSLFSLLAPSAATPSHKARSSVHASAGEAPPPVTDASPAFERIKHIQVGQAPLSPVDVVGAGGRKVVVRGVDLCRGSGGGGQNLGLFRALEHGGVELGFLQAFAVIRPRCRHGLPRHLRRRGSRIIRRPSDLLAGRIYRPQVWKVTHLWEGDGPGLVQTLSTPASVQLGLLLLLQLPGDTEPDPNELLVRVPAPCAAVLTRF